MNIRATRMFAAAALIAMAGLALAQVSNVKRIDLQRNDLSIPGRETVQAIVEIAPGTTAARHSHPGEEIIYVLEGKLVWRS
jgi:quercetin dioxygenase-like cupin family protein